MLVQCNCASGDRYVLCTDAVMLFYTVSMLVSLGVELS